MCYNFTGYNVKPYIIFRNTAKSRRPESDMVNGFPGGFREDWGSGLGNGSRCWSRQETKTDVDSLRYWNEIAVNASENRPP